MTTAKKFESMSKQERAMAVAKDALRQLRWMRVGNTGYLTGRLETMPNAKDDARDHLRDIRAKCSVCALGACLVAKISVFDRISMRSLVINKWRPSYIGLSSSQVSSLLKDVFTREQQCLIETAFEGVLFMARPTYQCDSRSYLRFEKDYDNARTYRTYWPKPNDRLRAILTNIVRNKGTFIPQNFDPPAKQLTTGTHPMQAA